MSQQKNNNLNEARKVKKDEFYTQLKDIEKELKYYHPHFKNKIIYCNCDDPEHSNFVNYFIENFKKLELKKLIVSCYNNNGKGIYLEYYEEQTLNNKELNDDGDFRSEECIMLLKQADVIVTNPPFSLFREYFNQLVEYNKKFLIIGNMNAITYKNIFPLFRDNKVWLGVTNFNKGLYFKVPSDFVYADSYKFKREQKGEKVNRVPSVCWFTNLDYKERHIKDLILTKKYNSEDYPKYDNYNAININKVKDIPMDYIGVLGVPVTFLDKYNPEQFKILGSNRGINQDLNKIYGKSSFLNGKETFKRIFIKKN